MIGTEVVSRGFSVSRRSADMMGWSFFFGWRTSQGGIACGLLHKPRLASRASCSKTPRVASLEYCRYHHASPAFKSSRLTLVPSGNSTSPTVRPCRSPPHLSTARTSSSKCSAHPRERGTTHAHPTVDQLAVLWLFTRTPLQQLRYSRIQFAPLTQHLRDAFG